MESLTRLRDSSPLEEVHPGWILEKLEGESPRVIGLLCRWLPGDKVRTLLSSWPARSTPLPKVMETYRVSEAIGRIVRGRIEERLALSYPRPSGGSFSFEHIPLLTSDDLRTFFRDLGLEEIRRGFSGVEPAVFRTFLSRFSTRDVKEIRRRISEGGPVPLGEREEAQRFLTSLPLNALSAEGLFREIGYAVFGRGVVPEENGLVEGISCKLSPEEGYRLKRVLHERGRSHPGEKIQGAREEILRRLFSLARQGLIGRYWKDMV
jgi:hypothetical protein